VYLAIRNATPAIIRKSTDVPKVLHQRVHSISYRDPYDSLSLVVSTNENTWDRHDDIYDECGNGLAYIRAYDKTDRQTENTCPTYEINELDETLFGGRILGDATLRIFPNSLTAAF
jgi:hypothetical protein